MSDYLSDVAAVDHVLFESMFVVLNFLVDTIFLTINTCGKTCICQLFLMIFLVLWHCCLIQSVIWGSNFLFWWNWLFITSHCLECIILFLRFSVFGIIKYMFLLRVRFCENNRVLTGLCDFTVCMYIGTRIAIAPVKWGYDTRE